MASKKMNHLKDLYLVQLRDLYSAESQIIEALPEMIETASDEELRSALEEHLEVTKEQKNRLEKIFDELDEKPGRHKCKGMEGLIEEGDEMLEKDGEASVIDAGIIAAAQRVEHYEIAGYGTVRTYAERLGETEAARLLDQTLNEEAKADETLTRIAERNVNRQAQMAGTRS